VREPEAGTKWSIRQAGALTAEHTDLEGLIGPQLLGQHREEAVCALRALASAFGCGAERSREAGRATPAIIDPSLRPLEGADLSTARGAGVLVGSPGPPDKPRSILLTGHRLAPCMPTVATEANTRVSVVPVPACGAQGAGLC
jgi:hypothetical protein